MNTAEKLDVVDEKTEVLVLGTNERLIREIGEKTKGLVISDNKTFESVKKARTEIVTVRTSINKARIAANQTHRDGIADNDLQAKSLTDIATEYEEPLQTQVKNWQAKKDEEKRVKEEAEQVRKDAHTTIINAIRNLPIDHVNGSVTQLQGLIDHYSMLVVTERVFEEYAIEAQQVLKNTLESLGTMLVAAKGRKAETDRQAKAQAQIDEQQKKLDKQRQEQEAETKRRKTEQDAEDKRLDDKREAMEKEQREVKEKVESERLAYEENDRLEREESERQQREEALRPDKEKLIAFADQIDGLEVPDIASDEAEAIIEGALIRLVATVTYIQQQCDDL